jgi:hypothetical protein
MTKQQRIEAVAMRIARLRGARFPAEFTEAEQDEAEKFVELYDVLRQADVQSERI